MPGPYRQRVGEAVAINATCVSCHEKEASEWRGSLHQNAYVNQAFQSALAVEPTPFCRGCHAPESDLRTLPDRAVGELGVGCVTCHVTSDPDVVLAGPLAGRSLSAALPDASRSTSAPHRVRRSLDLGRASACASCHEFGFPSAPSNDDAHFMQTTVREHERSSASGEPCAACHMPRVEGRRSHAFAEVRTPSWLREHIIVDAAVVDGARLRLVLSQTGAGHAFPTGDLFRRLEVGCELRADDGRVLRREVRHLARHFEIVPGKPGRQLVADDRVFDAPRLVELPLSLSPEEASPSARSGSVAWWVSLQRVASVGTGTDPTESKIESEVKLHSGLLPWEEK
jgi:hypothetical protein